MNFRKLIGLERPYSGTLLAAALVGISLLATTGAQAKTPRPVGLFEEGYEATESGLPAQAIKGKSRRVKINRKELRKGRLFIDLPGGVSFEAVREELVDLGRGRMAWVGHASGDPGNQVVLGVSGNSVSGTFSYHGKLFKLEPRKKGKHILSEVEPTDPAPELDPIPVAADAGGQSGAPLAGDAAADEGGTEIDVLVAYTPAIESLYGGAAGVDALAIQAVAETNQAYIDSEMSTRLKLVHTARVDYVESGSMEMDLSRLRRTGDGHMDEIHALRDLYGADVVSLIENESQYCGLGYLMAFLSVDFATHAFNVVHHSCATGYFSFGHEIGHNQGAHHDANNAGSAIFPYAYGYQDPNALFRTIMAYNCPGGCNRVGLFSNGDNPVYGMSTGIPGAAENALTIDQTAATVAAFRQSSTELPAPPSALLATSGGTDQVVLGWTDNADNEAEFVVERSDDSVNFSQVASLPANTVAYADAGLSPETLYSYRVRARNGAGPSAYSDTATVTTDAFPAISYHLALVETAGAGLVTGSRLDTHVDDGVSESIQEVDSGSVPGESYSHLIHNWVFDVAPGETNTLYADVDASSSDQSFTFAYATKFVSLEANPEAWVDMFTVDAGNAGMKQFSLPEGLSGTVFVSVRDNSRVAGELTADSVAVDYMVIQTENPTGRPPGC